MKAPLICVDFHYAANSYGQIVGYDVRTLSETRHFLNALEAKDYIDGLVGRYPDFSNDESNQKRIT